MKNAYLRCTFRETYIFPVLHLLLFMTDKQIDRLLTRMEREHEDELNMVNQFNMHYFSTDYLEYIYEIWCERCVRLRSFYKAGLKLMLVACACSTFGLLGLALEIEFLTTFLYIAFILMLAYCASMLYLNKNFGSIRRNEYVGEKIRTELRRRYDTTYI